LLIHIFSFFIWAACQSKDHRRYMAWQNTRKWNTYTTRNNTTTTTI